MSASTSIEWTGTTWNPLTGCTKISPGCKHCYAEKMATRLKSMGQKRYRNGFDLTLHREALEEPLRWRAPRTVFVNSMSDLFHKDVPDEFIASVFATMRRTPQHTYQVLTKRAEGLRDFCAAVAQERAMMSDQQRAEAGPWPLPNVWLGVSVEDQRRADERVPLLLQTPAAVRFLSIEPLLGPVRLCEGCPECPDGWSSGIDWVIVGGESGPGARPFDLAWARSLVAQCHAAKVACFVKQIGAYAVDSDPDGKPIRYPTKSRKGSDPLGWPRELRVREFPEVIRA